MLRNRPPPLPRLGRRFFSFRAFSNSPHVCAVSRRKAQAGQIPKRREDLRNRRVLDTIWQLAQSKFAIMDGGGYVATVGQFLNRDGLLFSNASYQGWHYR